MRIVILFQIHSSLGHLRIAEKSQSLLLQIYGPATFKLINNSKYYSTAFESSYPPHSQQQVIDEVMNFQPDIIVTEFFPFGRKKYQREILSMIKAYKIFNPKVSILSLARDIIADPIFREQYLDHQKVNTINNILENYYDKILLLGDQRFLAFDFPLSKKNQPKVLEVGYPNPTLNPSRTSPLDIDILVMLGGGFDGQVIIEKLLLAFSQDYFTEQQIIIVLGPFFQTRQYQTSSPNHHIIQDCEYPLNHYNPKLIISMSGYNSFSESVFTDSKILFIPRLWEKEQLQRAQIIQAQSGIDYYDHTQSNEILLNKILTLQKNKRSYPNLKSWQYEA